MARMKLIQTVAAGILDLVGLSIAVAAQATGDGEMERRGLVTREAGAFEGYTLFAPLSSRSIYLVDMEGNVVHEWETGHAPAGSVYLTDAGHLLRGARQDENPRFNGGGIGGLIQEWDWNGELVWEFEIADDYQTAHHDIEPMPNGNVLVIVWEHRFREDAIEFGRDPAKVGEAGMWPDAVLELKPVRPDDAEVVWEWHAWDHLVQDFDPDKAGYGSIPEHPDRLDINVDHRAEAPISEEERARQEEVEEQMRALGYVGGDEEEEEAPDAAANTRGSLPDWMHTNGIDYHPGLDLILLSSPELNEILVIDHALTTDEASWDSGGRWGKGGGLLYRLGNAKRYGLGGDADRRFFYQHDPQWVIDDQGGDLRFTVFNNGGGRTDGDYSSVEEFVIPFDPEQGFAREAGAPFGPAVPAWSYSDKGGFYSAFISGAQRLPNGNTLICSGAPGRIFEVTREGGIVWEYLNPIAGDVSQGQGGNSPPTALFRATRIAADHPGLSALAPAAGR